MRSISNAKMIESFALVAKNEGSQLALCALNEPLVNEALAMNYNLSSKARGQLLKRRNVGVRCKLAFTSYGDVQISRILTDNRASVRASLVYGGLKGASDELIRKICGAGWFTVGHADALLSRSTDIPADVRRDLATRERGAGMLEVMSNTDLFGCDEVVAILSKDDWDPAWRGLGSVIEKYDEVFEVLLGRAERDSARGSEIAYALAGCSRLNDERGMRILRICERSSWVAFMRSRVQERCAMNPNVSVVVLNQICKTRFSNESSESLLVRLTDEIIPSRQADGVLTGPWSQSTGADLARVVDFIRGSGGSVVAHPWIGQDRSGSVAEGKVAGEKARYSADSIIFAYPDDVVGPDRTDVEIGRCIQMIVEDVLDANCPQGWPVLISLAGGWNGSLESLLNVTLSSFSAQ